MISRVLVRVRAVLAGETKGDSDGKHLLDTLDTSTDKLEKGGFDSRLQKDIDDLVSSQLVRLGAEG